MALNIGNINDNKTEELIAFVRQVAEMDLYGSEITMPGDGLVSEDDATDVMNFLIEKARGLLKMKCGKT